MSEQKSDVISRMLALPAERQKGILQAVDDERVAAMAVDKMWGTYSMGQVMLTHLLNAAEVAHACDISITEVELACEVLIHKVAERGAQERAGYGV